MWSVPILDTPPFPYYYPRPPASLKTDLSLPLLIKEGVAQSPVGEKARNWETRDIQRGKDGEKKEWKTLLYGTKRRIKTALKQARHGEETEPKKVKNGVKKVRKRSHRRWENGVKKGKKEEPKRVRKRSLRRWENGAKKRDEMGTKKGKKKES